MKRVFDIGASALGIALLSPVIATISLASLIHFRANPLYFADRAGKDSKPFRMLKFRSMNEAVDENGESLPDKQRSTSYGHFLRATSLDELPQLVNILKGDMSFVGPRPRDPEHVESDKVPDDFKDIFFVRPGLTGPWQIAAIGRETPLPREDRLRLDASYARSTPTLGNDCLILLKTIPAFLRGHDGESLRPPVL